MKTEPTEAKQMIENSWLLSRTTINFKNDAIKAIDIAFQEGQSNPKIKQLEWKFNGIYYEAITNVGCYTIVQSEEYWENYSKSTLLHNNSIIYEADFDSIDEAKSAAQRDFEKRVKECLDLKAQQKQTLIDTMRGDEQIGLYDDNPKNHGYER